MVIEYQEWNTALWNFFFPNGNEDPVLTLDENLLRGIGENAGIRRVRSNWKDDFLSKTLIPQNRFLEFRHDWRCVVGNNCDSDRWDELVYFLEDKTLDGIPAYFAMLCAIMFIASTIDGRVTHSSIRNIARDYLGETYRNRHVGEFVDELFQYLHRDQLSFNPDKMDVSQRNMSRIKYHLVLKAEQRRDFIDFLEVGNLKWEEGSYADYANSILIPALHKANKPQRFFEIVENPEFIPYVKNILLSDLRWGKAPEDSVSNNTRQIRDVRWKFEMELDYAGEPSFFISTNSYLPFGIILNDNRFERSEEISDYIAYNVQLSNYDLAYFDDDGYEYRFLNLAQEDTGTWRSELFFQQVDDRLYHQVADPIEGKRLIKLIPTRSHANANGWRQSDIVINGYRVYETDSYVGNVRNRVRDNDRVKDTFQLYGLGSWFSICLEEGQNIIWKPEEFNTIETPIINTIIAPNGKTYFKLPRNEEGSYLRGNLFVRDERGNDKLSEQIKRDFLWDGHQMIYGYNEWGEVVEGGTIQRIQAQPTQRVILQPRQEEISNNPISEDSNMLIQILYDVADENGCVAQRKIIEVLKFVLDFYNVDPSKDRIKNRLLYALRRLGYVVALKINGEFVNQLVAPYLELTNYGIWEHNAYLVKGVYNSEALQLILQNLPSLNGNRPIKFKRPISNSAGTEYACLPDLILFYTDQPVDNWIVIDHPVAYDLLAAMADMRYFETHYSITEGGDQFITYEHPNTPCMIYNKGEEFLCLNRNDRYYKINNYLDDGIYKSIPKHSSRIYCQNIHCQPIVVMGTQRVDGQTLIDYDHITTIKGMGKPTLFDIALCDLNLGIPAEDYVFVMNNQNANLPIVLPAPYTKGNVYSTNGLHRDLMMTMLEKIGARRIDAIFNTSSIFVSAPKSRFKMMIEDVSSPKISLGIISIQANRIIAFSIGSSVYVWSTADNRYEEVVGENVNNKLSDVINNAYHTNGNIYNGRIPYFNGNRSQKVTIIKRNQ